MTALRSHAKRAAGGIASALNHQCRFSRGIFILGHMRCGSTALSNILCSRPEVSGYGEAHIAYRSRASLGELVINQIKHGAWRPRAPRLFDKILHSRYDHDAPEDFFQAKAIFIFRAPEPSVQSIRKLFDAVATGEYRDDAAAARYYVERLGSLARLWRAFPPDQRLATAYDRLTGDPDGELVRLSRFLGFVPALDNRYATPAATRRHGAGDSVVAPRMTRIVARPSPPPALPLDLAPSLHDDMHRSYEALMELAFATSG
jgi:hypothetical protein